MPATKPYERPKDFIDPGAPSKCLWKLGVKNKSPHTQRGMYVKKDKNNIIRTISRAFILISIVFSNSSAHRQKITPNILEVIGCTPLVKLNSIPKSEGIKCEMCK